MKITYNANELGETEPERERQRVGRVRNRSDKFVVFRHEVIIESSSVRIGRRESHDEDQQHRGQGQQLSDDVGDRPG